MEIYKIFAFAIVCAVLCFYLKNINSELFIPILLASGAILLYFSLDYLIDVTQFFSLLFDKTKIDKQIILLIFKIVLIAYLIEFTVSLIEDFGLKSLADKFLFTGKILLFCLSIPIFELFAKTIFSLI